MTAMGTEPPPATPAPTTASPTPESPRRWRRPGCLGLAIIIAALGFLILGISSVIWWNSEADLRRIDAKAHAEGIATTWEELGLKLSPAPQMEAMKELERLHASIKSYASISGTAASQPPRWIRDQSIPDEMRAFHASLNPVALEQCFQAIDALGTEPLIPRDRMDPTTNMYEFGFLRDYARFLYERIALAPPGQAAREWRRLLYLARSFPVGGLIHFMTQDSCLRMASTCLQERFNEVKESCPDGAEMLRAAATSIHDHAKRMTEIEFVFWRTQIKSPDMMISYNNGNNWLATTDSNGMPSWLGGILDWSFRRLAMGTQPIRVRWFREKALGLCLENIHLTREAWMQEGLFTQTRERDLDECPCDKNAFAKIGYYYLIKPTGGMIGLYRQQLETGLHLNLLAAEMDGSPWPIDPYDPQGGRLRKVERDGKVMGAYSLGPDGVDKGGERPNIYFAIRGPREAPK